MGTGGFNFLSDGGFGHFRTNHNWFRFIKATRYPKGTFFAVRVKTPLTTTSRILRRQYQGGNEFQNITNIAHTKFTGKLPHFKLQFEDPNLPINITTSGFSALIPRNPKDSTLPAAFFTITVENPTEDSIDVSVLFAFENILGLGGSGGSHLLLLRDGPVAYRSTRGNFAEIFESKDGTGVCFKTTQHTLSNDPRRRTLGEYDIFIPHSPSLESDIKISSCTAWSSKTSKPTIFNDFHQNGEINQIYTKKKPNAGALCAKFHLAPKQTYSEDFILLWWTPYYVLEKYQRIRKITGNHAGFDYGHYYLNFFQTATTLADYCITERKRLETESLELERILIESTLPSWLQTYVLNSVDSILVNTCVPKDGKFYMIEGCPWDWMFGGLTGTLDQRLASHPYCSIFFPEFDRTELETFRDLGKKGQIPHGDGDCDVALGTEDVPYGKPILIISKTKYWTDLPQSLILQMGKLFMNTGDWVLLRKSWPHFVEMMTYLASVCINHIPDGITTYDYMYYRPHFVYSAILQLATLQMITYLGNQLARHPEITSTEKKSIMQLIPTWEQEYQACFNALQQILWNSEGYFKTCTNRETIFTSALAGDWFAHYCGFDSVIKYDQAFSHSIWQSRVLVDSHNQLKRKKSVERPLVYREADKNGREIPMQINLSKIFQVNNPWQSLAYQAFEAIYLGRIDAGFTIIKRIWDKGYYEGYPWNMDHWGFSSHIYMTHPTMWAVFNAITGAALDVPNQTLTLSPRSIPDQKLFRVPVFFPYVWLWVNYNPANCMVRLEIIKSFAPNFVIQNIKCRDISGIKQNIVLDPPLHNRAGEQIQFQFPFPIKRG